MSELKKITKLNPKRLDSKKYFQESTNMRVLGIQKLNSTSFVTHTKNDSSHHHASTTVFLD
ncbi:CLUMA_CG017326, isoform A [Clunio marinus]|uniref:CLUMA_CG017326, isoform A n=1 Tax=Clunio marinus TaxID=568069 RepID=A0A1J1IVI4_9DIPT|nr:CLUMA_CG017326, isoform A [Clunio marinus]